MFESFTTYTTLLSNCYFKVGFTWSKKKISSGTLHLEDISIFLSHNTLSVLSIFSSLFSILAAEKLQFVILPPASYFFLKVNTIYCL